MVKLTIIITGLATGGAQVMLLKILQRIDRRYFNISVISLTTKGDIGPQIEALGIPLFSLEMRRDIFDLIKFFQLIGYLRDTKPDLVHTWLYHADFIGGLASYFSGTKKLVWGLRHSNLSPEKNKSSILLLARLCACLSKWLPDKILSCSERAIATHIDAGYCSDKMVFIPNGFDLSKFTPNSIAGVSVRNELGLDSDALLVGLIARDDPQKNISGFIDATVLISKEAPGTHFLFAGSQVDESNHNLIQAISNSGDKNYFHLLGRRDDIPRLMAALDVLASSSWGEAFPNVLGEAMACGVPCVVTDVGDSAAIVGETGRVVSSGDMVGLAREILKFLLDADLRASFGIRARERMHQNFEIGAITRQYEGFYLKLVGRN